MQLTAEQLVFVDETLFNETTGWHQQAYAPVGEPARYQASRKRGHSWSVLPAYTIDGYLPCIGIREGWSNGEALALRAASALALPEGLFDLDEVLERMSGSFRGRFWLRRDDGMMASGVGRGGGYKDVSTVKRLNSFIFTCLIDFSKTKALKV